MAAKRDDSQPESPAVDPDNHLLSSKAGSGRADRLRIVRKATTAKKLKGRAG